jgi:PKD repeat protein
MAEVPATLDGSTSSDPDNEPAPLSFNWTQTAGPTVTLTDANTATPTFTPDEPGSYTFNLFVSDGLDSVPDSITVKVVYNFTGFSPPVDNLPVLNEVKAGLAVPLKFSLGGDQGLDIFAPGYPVSQPIACGAGTLDAVEQTVTAGSSGLSYDPSTGQYTYVWKTNKAWAGTCRQINVKLDDGTDHKANFKFK